MNLLACLLCAFALGLSLWFLIKSKCQHLEWDWGGNRCITCGISMREQLINGKLLCGGQRFTRSPNPYSRFDMWPFIQYRIEDDPASGRVRFIEYVVDDAPQIVKEQHAEMMQRREGLAWYKPIIWRDC